MNNMIRLKAFRTRLRRFFTPTKSAQTMPVTNQLRMVRLFQADEKMTVSALKQSFRLLQYSPECEKPWIELLNSNNVYGVWDDARFAIEMIGNLHPGTETLREDGGKIIGSCAAYAMKAHEPYAVLAYPVVHPRYRRQRIGTFLVAYTLVKCQLAGYPGIILHTDDFRIPAIRTYLKL